MDSLNHDNQADVIETFNSTSRFLDDLLNIEGMVNQIYPPELQLNKANISDTEALFLDSHVSVANGFVSSKLSVYDKRDDCMRGSRNFNERGSNENGNFWSQRRGVQPPKNPEITFFLGKIFKFQGGSGPPVPPPLDPRMDWF